MLGRASELRWLSISTRSETATHHRLDRINCTLPIRLSLIQATSIGIKVNSHSTQLDELYPHQQILALRSDFLPCEPPSSCPE